MSIKRRTFFVGLCLWVLWAVAAVVLLTSCAGDSVGIEAGAGQPITPAPWVREAFARTVDCIGEAPSAPFELIRWRVVDGDVFNCHGVMADGCADIEGRTAYVARAALALNITRPWRHEPVHIAYRVSGHPWRYFGACGL